MTRYSSTMTEALQEIREGFSSKQIKMAIGIASDKRYAGGNMTGAVNAIEKIKKGLSDHPQVAAVLKRQNEDIQEDGHTDVASAKNQVKVAMTALQKMEMELGKLNDEDSLPSWWTNKVAIAVDKIDGMADYLDTQVEGVEPIQWPSQPLEESVTIDELKMDDPKLNKVFDKLKRGDTVKLKTSSTISKGTDFVDYVVKSKNTVNKGRVEKITLATKGNEGAVKKFLYKRDGKVTFAIGDMGASIDDIKEAAHELAEKLKVSDGLGAWITDFQKSDAPQFAGKSDEDKKKMAIAAFVDAGGKLDEMAYKPGSPKVKDIRPQEKAAKALDALIKSGGLDKSDFQKARAMYVQASDMQSRRKLKNFISNLDTEPLEAILDIIGRNDPDTFQKMYPNSKPGEYLSTIAYKHRNAKNEETELDEKTTKTFGVEFQINAPDEKPIRTGNEPHVKLVNKLVKKYKLFDNHADDLSKFNVKDDVGGRDVQKFFNDLSKAGYDVVKKKVTDNYTSRTLGKEGFELDEAPKMKYALVGTDMKIYSMGSDERDLRLDRKSLEKRFKDVAPLKMARLKTAQSIGDKVDKSQLKEEGEPQKPDTAKAVDQMRDDKKKTRIAQLQLQIAKAPEMINKLNAQEKPNG